MKRLYALLLALALASAACKKDDAPTTPSAPTYQEVFARAPTADSHFLLAQFYDDTQQTRKAREHARRAMTLAPQRYQQEGEKLIRKLTVFHFGCFHVFSAEND